MNFIELTNDLRSTLSCTRYVDFLWDRITGTNDEEKNLDDYDAYKSHLPLELSKFLRVCLDKLKSMERITDPDTWGLLDQKYISTFVHFIVEEETFDLEDVLIGANIFVLLNIISIPNQQSFYKVTYLKVLHVMTNLHHSHEITSDDMLIFMKDFKAMLLKTPLCNEVIIPTVAVLQMYTYCCNEVFENIDENVSHENLGYIAFVSLKILARQLVAQKNQDKLYSIILCLMSHLKLSTMNNLHRTVRTSQQKNVILFINGNLQILHTPGSCLIMNALKTICLASEYNDHEGIAQFIQHLPSELNQEFFVFFSNTMICTRTDFKKNLLHLVIPLLRHPPEYESTPKRLIKAKIFLTNAVMMIADKSDDVKLKAIQVVTESSEDSLGRRVLRKIMSPDNKEDINKDSIQDVLYSILDESWTKKGINISYIQLICNLFIIRKDLVTIKALNRLRNICIKGSPFDLKPCTTHLKRLLEYHSNIPDVTMYILSIFTKQMLHEMSTSSVFAKELHQIIFSNISANETDNFVWNVINYLISHSFPVYELFKKFHSLQLLQERVVRILMEYKIHEENSRSPALKLLCVMLNFVQYSKCHLLEEMLEEWISEGSRKLSSTDLSFVIYALTKIMKRKQRSQCNESDLQNLRQMQHIVYQAFFDQLFPIDTIGYVIDLLSIYSSLTDEDALWDRSAYMNFEEGLRNKLGEMLSTALKHYIYLSRDVMYIGELILMKKIILNETTFALLKKIVCISDHTREFLAYLKNNQEMWSSCILLYIKACFINTDLIETCVEEITYILSQQLVNDHSTLQIVYGLYDICVMHLEYYDPIIPVLFQLLNSKNGYVRFICTKILMKLVQGEHLRLIDGHYYVFMMLLCDKNQILCQNVELFVRNWFVPKFAQSIAGNFIPSIIHYNFCYTYPGVSLLQAEQELLKQKQNSLSNRRPIYYTLFRYLSNNLKFNIIKQMAGEFLAKISKKSLENVSKVPEILEDTLFIILLLVPKEALPEVVDTKTYFDKELKHLTHTLVSVENVIQNKDIKTEKSALRSVCFNLIRLLYNNLKQDAKMYQNVLYTLSVLGRHFEDVIKQILSEDCHLKELFTSLKKFYQKNIEQFAISNLTVATPFFSSTNEDNIDFYWREMENFTTIHPCKIFNIDH
ncbi:hypothetical protein FQA39_LY10238 [Lamprigera yunnana]|nr:hypothetical protein FQA39_LY10238 [Lamprigera yunnana]